MKNQLGGLIFSLISYLLPLVCFGQNIFSEEDFDYNKTFLPYDIAYTFPLEEKEFVMLREVKKNNMKLGRYDQYFFEKWEKEVEFNIVESVPQVFIKGDTVVAFSLTTIEDTQQIRITFRYFDISNGAEYSASNLVTKMVVKEGFSPKISFSNNRSKFVIYNYLVNEQDSNKAEFQIFNIGNEKPLKQYYLKPEILAIPRNNSVHLSDDGDLFFVVAEAINFKIETYFWSSKSKGVNQVNNNFFFERPVDNL